MAPRPPPLCPGELSVSTAGVSLPRENKKTTFALLWGLSFPQWHLGNVSEEAFPHLLDLPGASATPDGLG